ncbi:MAG: hypothetical protein H0W64_07985 [Gammaproteobacteria bacterium]|nr:hypothetical protein [Gammaproteobacteria bacterium]
MKQFFIGIDGGASKTIVRVEDDAGNLIARSQGGSASIRISILEAWRTIHETLLSAFRTLEMPWPNHEHAFHCGLGLAGFEIHAARMDFLAVKHPFATLALTSDAHIACLGAHLGHDGAIIIVGTGSVGFQIEDHIETKVGGWGFPHDDEGSGAWLGLEAVKHTVRTYDGRVAPSLLSQSILNFFEQDYANLINWANAANSTGFATLAPLILAAQEQGCLAAQGLLENAGEQLYLIAQALEAKRVNTQHVLPCSLLGGLAQKIKPFLPDPLRQNLIDPAQSPDQGAILFIREHVLQKELSTGYQINT